MKGLAGVTTGFLFCWILHRLIMQDDYVLQENVQSFTTSIISETLGHMYHVEQALLDPRDFGWPIARVRKYTVLLHKTKTGAMTQPLNVFARLFHRQLAKEDTTEEEITVPEWDIFLTAGPSELMGELLWACGRPHSESKDMCPDEIGLSPLDNTAQGSFWLALTSSEQKFLDEYQHRAPGQVYQLNQNPKVTATMSDNAHLATIIKNSGVLWPLART